MEEDAPLFTGNARVSPAEFVSDPWSRLVFGLKNEGAGRCHFREMMTCSSEVAMSIFKEKDFYLGAWGSPLARVLKERKILPDLDPVCRILRNTTLRWVQYQPPGLKGPEHWLAKPAILPSESKLFAGCFVERGLPKELAREPEYIFGKSWRWHGFIACLEDPDLRARLHAYMTNLTTGRSCIRTWVEHAEDHVDAYTGADCLLALRDRLKTIPADKWITCVLGVQFTKIECLDLQEKIVLELRNPIIRASEMTALFEECTPK